MWHRVKFQFALLFTILRTSGHLGVAQLKDGATADSHVENIINIEGSHTQAKGTPVRIPQIAGHTNITGGILPPVCDDSSDQDPASCNNCSQPSLYVQ